MWFKNIQVYRFTRSIEQSAEDIAGLLERHEFTPCSTQQPNSTGWTSPLGRQGSDFVHAANGYIMVCNKTQEKLLPAAVVNEELEEKVLEIEEAQARKVSRKERTSLKEEITFNLLPMAFARSRVDFAYLCVNEGMLVLNSSSEKKADELVSNLRKALGSLPVVPLECLSDPVATMTDWVKTGRCSADFSLGEECELQSESDSTRVIRCKNQDLGTDEILAHLKAGMRVTKLALTWKDRLDFVLDEKLMLKRISFTDVMQDELANNSESADDKVTQFDVDFSIMTLEFSSFINDLTVALGGVRSTDVERGKKGETDDNIPATASVDDGDVEDRPEGTFEGESELEQV